MNQKEIKVGDIVKYIGNNHDIEPEWYPFVGTIGVVKSIDLPSVEVEWEEGSTSGDDCWYCGLYEVKVVSSVPKNEESKRIELDKNMVGKKVRLVNEEEHYYTVPNGSVGTIIDFDEYDDICPYQVKWESGNISWVFTRDIEKVEPDPIPEMTNEEIREMLKPKMEKNGLVPCGSRPLFTNGVANVYAWESVHNAIALAYRSGYKRAIKGRPFKIGGNKTGHSEPKKEKTGHWVPVDPDNPPKEGTRVRYSRESKEYSIEKEPMIAIGDIGEFSYGKTLGLPGIRFNDGRFWNWVSFNNEPECLDMWVEDDE